MARALQQVLTELEPYYANSRSLYQSQLDAAPAQQDAELAGLDARLGQANENILAGARSRGLGFSGIPVAEQAKYAATDYAPAVAGLKGKYVTQKNSLLESINSIGREQLGAAQGIVNSETQTDLERQKLAEQQRQFNLGLDEQRKARTAAAGGSPISFGGGGGAPQAATRAPAAAKIEKRNDGFFFFDGAGRPINAAQYASLTGRGYRDLLAQMAKEGDRNAQVALQYVGNDAKFGNAPTQLRGALGALGATGSYGVSTGGGRGW